MTTQHQEPGVGTPAPHTEAEAALGPDEFDDRLVKTGSVRKVLMSQEFGAAVAALLIFIGFSIAAPVFATRQGIGNFLDPAATQWRYRKVGLSCSCDSEVIAGASNRIVSLKRENVGLRCSAARSASRARG